MNINGIFAFLLSLIKAEEWFEDTGISNNMLNTPLKATSALELQALTDFYTSLNGDSWYFFTLQ